MDDTSICDELLMYHKNNPNKFMGHTSTGVDKNKKDSIDCTLDDINLLKKYGNLLQTCIELYADKYHFCDWYSPWSLVSPVNIQQYKPNGGYHEWHTERTSKELPSASRHLVFMTYLNNVSDCGETEFFYQKVKVKPEKGLTLIWGADWTFTHRGIPSPSQEKYIATGWFNYV